MQAKDDDCSDVVGWRDSRGWSCEQYVGSFWCAPGGGYGEGWQSGWGAFGNYSVGGIDASEACCGCRNEVVNCEVEEWAQWTVCTATCGAGSQVRWRFVLQQAAGGGQECPLTIESRMCGPEECVRECEVGHWAGWTSCSTTCGIGSQMRWRPIIRLGERCPKTFETRRCGFRGCVEHCRVGEWVEWTGCPATCLGGTEIRWRPILRPALNNGSTCPDTFQTRPCGPEKCTEECVQEWAPWTQCSATCGGGSQLRWRSSYLVMEGSGCPVLNETRECGLDPCVQDCELGPWEEWTSCSASCGEGSQLRWRPILQPSTNVSTECPPATETQKCHIFECNERSDIPISAKPTDPWNIPDNAPTHASSSTPTVSLLTSSSSLTPRPSSLPTPISPSPSPALSASPSPFVPTSHSPSSAMVVSPSPSMSTSSSVLSSSPSSSPLLLPSSISTPIRSVSSMTSLPPPQPSHVISTQLHRSPHSPRPSVVLPPLPDSSASPSINSPVALPHFSPWTSSLFHSTSASPTQSPVSFIIPSSSSSLHNFSPDTSATTNLVSPSASESPITTSAAQPSVPTSHVFAVFDGPQSADLTSSEVITNTCLWRYMFSNGLETVVVISVMSAPTIFTDQSLANVVLQPATSAEHCLRLTLPSETYVGTLQSTISAVIIDPSAVLLHTTTVSIYVVPTPIIWVRGSQSGPVVVVHVGSRMEAQLHIEGDTQPSIFQGVHWAIKPYLPIEHWHPLQRRMTVAGEYLTKGANMTLRADVTFTMISRNITKSVEQWIITDEGPDGTTATFHLEPLPINTSLHPQLRYRVIISGWRHWAEMRYSVWCYFTSSDSKPFRLSVDSPDPEHHITIPFVPPGERLILFVKATDCFGYPHVTCLACSREISTQAIPMPSVPSFDRHIGSVADILDLLVAIGKTPLLSDESLAAFLSNVQIYLKTSPSEAQWVISQTALSWDSHLWSRPLSGIYDASVVQLLSSFISPTMPVTAFNGIAELYASALLRSTLPLVMESEEVWAALPSMISQDPVDTHPDPSLGSIGAVLNISKFQPQSDGNQANSPPNDAIPSSPSNAAFSIPQRILSLLQTRAYTATFRDVDCLPKDPNVEPDDQCFLACTLTCYKEELLNNSHLIISPFFSIIHHNTNANGLIQFLLLNEQWISTLQPSLPDIVTVAWLQLNADCNAQVVPEHLAGPLWAVQLLNASSLSALPLNITGYTITMPMPMDWTKQDCKVKEEGYDHFRTLPSRGGLCISNTLNGWFALSDPRTFPPATGQPFTWVIPIAIGSAACSILLLALCLLLLIRHWSIRRRRRPDAAAMLLLSSSSSTTGTSGESICRYWGGPWPDSPPPSAAAIEGIPVSPPPTLMSPEVCCMPSWSSNGSLSSVYLLSKFRPDNSEAVIMDGDSAKFHPWPSSPVCFFSQFRTQMSTTILMPPNSGSPMSESPHSAPRSPAIFMSRIRSEFPDSVMMNSGQTFLQIPVTHRYPGSSMSAEFLSVTHDNVPDAVILDTVQMTRQAQGYGSGTTPNTSLLVHEIHQ